MSKPWWEDFFDADYLRLWRPSVTEERTRHEAEGLWQLLGLQASSRVLDAPCGYGRLSKPLAERGAYVLGADRSQLLVERAEQERGELPKASLRYLRHDLRHPLSEGGFDVAINIFSSLGYGTEEDDLRIVKTLAQAVRPGGFVFFETNHRDPVVAMLSRGSKPAQRLPDGTLVVEELEFDAVQGRIETCWYWSGPSGSGQKSASLRIYSATELLALLERAGLRFQSAHKSCSPEPFMAEGSDMGGHLGLLAKRP